MESPLKFNEEVDESASFNPSSKHEGLNLLRLPVIKTLLGARWFPMAFQILLLVCFIALAVLSWDVYPPSGVKGKLFAKTNLVTLIVWGLWWPAMVWFAVLFGRAWCMICPLELVSSTSESIARRLRIPQRPLARWIAAGGAIVVVFAVLQMLVAGVSLHRMPAYTSWLLIGLLGMAAITGLLFRNRAFCRGFCPAALLLGTYGRGGMLAVRPSSDSKDGKCIAGSCASLLNSPKLNSNKDCLVCGQCFNAGSHDSMQLLLRRPFPASDAREPKASWPITIFVILASGFVTMEVCSEWAAAEEFLQRIPTQLAAALHSSAAGGWIKGIWGLFVLPLLLWSALAGLMRLFGQEDRILNIWRRIALPMAVVIAAGHMSKGLAKFVSWVQFLPLALQEPKGTATVKAITAKSMVAPSPIMTLPVVAAIAIVLMVLAWFISLREYRLAHRNELTVWSDYLPMTVLAVAFGSIIAGWMFQ